MNGEDPKVVHIIIDLLSGGRLSFTSITPPDLYSAGRPWIEATEQLSGDYVVIDEYGNKIVNVPMATIKEIRVMKESLNEIKTQYQDAQGHRIRGEGPNQTGH